ncbi:MAG: RNA polymerase factor sigma-54 [Bacteroidota bacterium]
MLKQSISQAQQQRLSPQQIQLMKLLQVPTASLEEWIQKELEENPILEEEARIETTTAENSSEENEEPQQEQADIELEEYVQEYADEDPYSYKLTTSNQSSDVEEKTIPIAVQDSFHDFLMNQRYLFNIKDEQTKLCIEQLIGSIDGDGYLRRDLSAVLDDLMFTQNIFVEEGELERILKLLQRKIDPAGVGARDLRENLMLQLHRKVEQDYEYNIGQLYALNLAYQILEYHFDAFSKKHFERLKDTLNIEDDDLKSAIDEILKLNPKPASGFADNRSSAVQYIIPDFFVHNRGEELELSLNNDNAPELRVSPHYQSVLRNYSRRNGKQRLSSGEKKTVSFIKEKIDKAKWFIDAIQQRQQTMYKTMHAILEYQYSYFLTGDEMQLRPMVLKDIAEQTNLDISTISRVVNSKYVQTEFGIKLLKSFFSEGMQNADGDEVSTIEIKKVLQQIVDEENKRKPLSDEKLKVLLKAKGYDVARRTVAKYRDQLNIPVARLRKAL